MSVFDYKSFFEMHNIHYVESGKNTRKGEYGIKCPWCGHDDPSEHLNVNPDTGVYGCWRNNRHSGKNATKLVAKLLGCDWAEAARITKQRKSVALDTFDSKIDNWLTPSNSKSNSSGKKLDWPEYMCPIKEFGAGRLYVKYLASRGFDDAEKVSELYGLRYGREIPWTQRVIFPLLDDKRELAGWVGRSIRADSKLRYRALSKDEGAIRVTKEVLFRPFNIEDGGKVLYITEGPFDALKLDYYGHEYGLRATCIFGLNYSEIQAFELKEMAKNFDEVRVMLDKTATLNAVSLVSDLSCSASICSIPYDVKDPGELKKNQILDLAKRL